MTYSVIIPIYNAEKTLSRCIDSLVRQDRKDVELILINDGSTDRSGEICKEYQQKCGNIRYFVQENRGVSAARNVGLAEAQGEYVLFVDSDDYVSQTYFEIIDAALVKEKADLLLFGFSPESLVSQLSDSLSPFWPSVCFSPPLFGRAKGQAVLCADFLSVLYLADISLFLPQFTPAAEHFLKLQ